MADGEDVWINILIGIGIILLAIFIFPIFPGEILLIAGLLASLAILALGLVLLYDFFKHDLEKIDKIAVLLTSIVAIIFGIVLIITVFGASDEIILTILDFFTIALIIIGVERLIGGLRSDTDSKGLKILTIVIGLLIAVLALVSIFIPVDLGFLGIVPGNNDALVSLLAIDILLIGVSRILKGIELKKAQ